MCSTSRCRNATYLCGPANYPVSWGLYLCGPGTTASHRWRYRAETENLCKLGGPVAMVLCLHQRNVYIQSKLQVGREQKCNPLVGAETPLTCVGRQTTLSHWGQYRRENGN